MGIQSLNTGYLCPSDYVKSTVEDYLYVWLTFMARQSPCQKSHTDDSSLFVQIQIVRSSQIHLFIPHWRGAHTPSLEAKVIVPYLISFIDITTGAMSSASNSRVSLIILGAGVTGLTNAHLAACDHDHCERYAWGLGFLSLGCDWPPMPQTSVCEDRRGQPLIDYEK